MSIRTKATRLGALVGAAALLGGLAIGAGVVHGQTATPTATATAAATAAPTAAATAVAPAPAARPALPNTGTGGLLGGSQSDATSIALLGIILGAVALSATGLVAYRRSR